MFFINFIVLGTVLYIGTKSYKKQVKNSEKRIPNEKTRMSVKEKTVRQMYYSINTFTQNDRDIVASALGLTFALSGYLYPLLSVFSVPFLIYAGKEYLKEAYRLSKQGKADVETLISIGIVGSVILRRFIVLSSVILIDRLANKLTGYVMQDSKKN